MSKQFALELVRQPKHLQKILEKMNDQIKSLFNRVNELETPKTKKSILNKKGSAKTIVIVLLSIVMVVGTAYALSRHSKEVITNIWHFQAPVKFGANDGIKYTWPSTSTTGSLRNSSGTLTWTAVTTARDVQLPIGAFILPDGRPITKTTVPGYELDDSVPAIVWADSEVSRASITFRVPADYSSGGAFRVFATESDSTTPNQVDFDVYVNADGSPADAAASDQIPAALAGTTATGDEVTLTVVTDFASLTAGKIVTFSMWRDNTAIGTGDLEIKNAAFYYTATQ